MSMENRQGARAPPPNPPRKYCEICSRDDVNVKKGHVIRNTYQKMSLSIIDIVSISDDYLILLSCAVIRL